MTPGPLLGVKVTKKPSEEAQWSAPKLPGINETPKRDGIPDIAGDIIPIGVRTSNMRDRYFSCTFSRIPVSCVSVFFGKFFKITLLREKICKDIAISQIPMIRIIDKNITIILISRFLAFSSQNWNESLAFTRDSFHLLDNLIATKGISAGAYAALISWIQGNQYTSGDSHHQIMTHPNLRGPIIVHLTTLLAPDPTESWLGDVVRSSLEERSTSTPRHLPVRGGDRFEKMSVLSRILREKGIVTTDDFRSPWSKGSQETFRRGALARAETPIGRNKERPFRAWNQQRSYREHPYWTANLRYVC
jgi:hypothetical protein